MVPQSTLQLLLLKLLLRSSPKKAKKARSPELEEQE